MLSFDTPALIAFGLLTGLVFGFLLQKAHVTRYDVILKQFLFRDFTVLKVMLTAIVVGAVGIYAMKQGGIVTKMHIKEAALGATIFGGLIFGVGMALLGYCPGTGVAALGDGSRHAIPGVLGMVVGAGVYAEVHPSLEAGFLKLWEVTATVGGKTTSKITLADLTQLSPWLFIAALAVIAGVAFYLIERWERTPSPLGRGQG